MPNPGRGRGAASTKWCDDDVMSRPENFLQRLTVIYGPSGSGKTVLLRAILQLLKGVPEGTFFSGTSDSLSELPKAFVHERVTEDVLQKIWDRQGVKTDIYKRVNRLDLLAQIAARRPDGRVSETVRKVEALRAQERAKLGSESKAFELVSSKCDELLNRVYKKHIETWRKQIEAQSLSEDEAYAMRFLNFNPHHVVVFDDVSPQVKKIQKKEIVGEIFTRARHRFLTIIFGLHGDKFIDPEYRRNAHVSIFTTAEEIQVFVKRDCMGIGSEVRAQAEAIAVDPRAFADFHKILYIKDSPTPFVRFRAEKVPKGQLKFGSLSWRALGNRISSDGTNDAGNPFNLEFVDGGVASGGARGRAAERDSDRGGARGGRGGARGRGRGRGRGKAQ